MANTPSVRDILDVAIECYALKDTARTGWVKLDIRKPRIKEAAIAESVAEHIGLMGILASLFIPIFRQRMLGVDEGKLLKLISVHDLAESVIGDIASDGTENKQQKYRNELAVMERFAAKTGNPELLALWNEFETGTSVEAQVARDLDKLEMFIQAYFYQQAHPERAVELAEFWKNDSKKIQTDTGREILAEIASRREALGSSPIVEAVRARA